MKAGKTAAGLSRIVLALAAFAAPAAAQIHAVAAEAPTKLKESPTASALPETASVVTRVSAERFAAAEFAFADADGNQKLTQTEFVALIAARQDALKTALAGPAVNETTPAAADAQAALATTPSAAADAAPGETVEAPAAKTPADIFAGLAGAQKTIAKKAFLEARLAQFDAADADKDGKLSDTEQSVFVAAIAGQG